MRPHHYENIPPTHADLFKRNLDYFYPTRSDAKTRIAYKQRNIIPTHNFGTLIVDESVAEIAPDFPNHYDYRQRPYGELIIRLRDEHPEVWQRARDGFWAGQRAVSHYADLLYAGKEAEAVTIREEADRLFWEGAAACSAAYAILAPKMLAAGFDPIEVCR